ncbi:alkaline phosphatase family protein [bacterium]|nr:alkaline phosphatase family protein [bacterium]
MKPIKRRDFIKWGATAGSFLAVGGGSDLVTRVFGKTDTPKKAIVLGFDGIDPQLLEHWMNEGKLPSFQKLRRQGGFRPLQTSIPPQSPVAWSNFINGTNPGGHAIFDFIHRNPENYIPIFSASKTIPPNNHLSLGNLKIPLTGGDVKLMRKGKAFWQILGEHDIPATVFKIPSNYPPDSSKQRTLSGMGTPDILGSYGIFNFYTTAGANIDENLGGGRIHQVYVIGNRVETKLPGPVNSFKQSRPETEVEFKVYIDPKNPVAKIAIQGQEFILKEGEWSGWKRIHFHMIPTQSVSGICRFYLKQIRPEFKLYVSPVNIDPADPALPISTPQSYAQELENKFGPFYTQGLPADTSALDSDILDDEEFLHQDDIVLQERKKMYEYELSRFESGLLFYYLSSTDQRQHMFWRHIDPHHPIYQPQLAAKYGNAIENIYKEADKMLGKALNKADKNTVLMVMSDHGFTPFRRSFNVNTWLKEMGYLNLINERKQGEEDFFLNTDWSHTKAYALGLNSLYINQRGREGQGIVPSGKEKENLVREIAKNLEKFRDPKTGEKVVRRAFVTQDVYTGDYAQQAPDIILGFNRGYRTSWSSPLGKIPKPVIEDNKEKWSGDHCMDPQVIPGIFLANRRIKANSPALYDLTPTILKIFGIKPPPHMIGKPVL